MSQDKGRFRRQLIIGVLVKIGLLALLWFALARPVLMKKSDAGGESRHPVLALVQAAQGDTMLAACGGRPAMRTSFLAEMTGPLPRLHSAPFLPPHPLLAGIG